MVVSNYSTRHAIIKNILSRDRKVISYRKPIDFDRLMALWSFNRACDICVTGRTTWGLVFNCVVLLGTAWGSFLSKTAYAGILDVVGDVAGAGHSFATNCGPETIGAALLNNIESFEGVGRECECPGVLSGFWDFQVLPVFHHSRKQFVFGGGVGVFNDVGSSWVAGDVAAAGTVAWIDKEGWGAAGNERLAFDSLGSGTRYGGAEVGPERRGRLFWTTKSRLKTPGMNTNVWGRFGRFGCLR